MNLLNLVSSVEKDRYGKEERYVSWPKVITCGILFILLLITFFTSFTIIPSGKTGVKERFGIVEEKNLNPGIVWHLPWGIESINIVNNRQRDKVIESQVWCETSERTEIYYENITITYKIEEAKSAYLVKYVQDYEKSMFSVSLVSSALKTTSKQFSSTDATNRALIEPVFAQELQKAFDDKYGPDTITVIKTVIGNADFRDDYNAAIANKQTAQIQYEAQQIENQRLIELAEAENNIKIQNANADAEAELIAAQAYADANAIREKSLTPTIMNYEIIKTWDGRLPMFGNSSFTPVLDVGSLMEETTDSQSQG